MSTAIEAPAAPAPAAVAAAEKVAGATQRQRTRGRVKNHRLAVVSGGGVMRV
jgi:hypothetical protein